MLDAQAPVVLPVWVVSDLVMAAAYGAMSKPAQEAIFFADKALEKKYNPVPHPAQTSIESWE